LKRFAVVALEVALPDFYRFPALPLDLPFSREQEHDLLQILLATLRIQKTITLPAPLSPNMPEFEPKTGLDASLRENPSQDMGIASMDSYPLLVLETIGEVISSAGCYQKWRMGNAGMA